MPIVDFERADGECGHVESTAASIVACLGNPASSLMPFSGLSRHESVANGAVPATPATATVVVKGLRGIVPVVNVDAPATRRRFFEQVVESFP